MLSCALAPACFAMPGVGADASYPQCGTNLESAAYYVIGVNGGIASRANPCLSLEYSQAVTASAPDRVALYVNSGNPGEALASQGMSNWPKSNRDIDGATLANPYGTCAHDDSAGCAYTYGYRMAERDIVDAYAAGVIEPDQMTWWIDVETYNSWETDTPGGQARDVADLEGMAAALLSSHAELSVPGSISWLNYKGVPIENVGYYSTDQQWQQITGGSLDAGSVLAVANQWHAGASSVSGAAGQCGEAPFAGTTGRIDMVQWAGARYDLNISCN